MDGTGNANRGAAALLGAATALALLAAGSTSARGAGPETPVQVAQGEQPQDAGGTLTIAEDAAVTTVIERFAVPPDRQSDAIAKARAATEAWAKDDDFIGYVLLRSRQKAGGIAIYSQWVRGQGEALAASPQQARSLRAALEGYETLDSENFEVVFTKQDPDLKPSSQASLATTPLAHFGLFRIEPANYDELIRRARKFGPNSFRVDGLRSINFHHGASGRFVVNFGLWDSFDHFAELQKAPGFARKDQYYLDLSDFKPDFFDVVAVVSGSD